MYRAPGPLRPGRVRHVRVRRHGSRVLVQWRPARSAEQHEVRLRLSDGRRLSFRTGRNRLAVRGVGGRVHGRVSVRGIVPQGVPGRAARKRL